jgi:hypothetical protein
MVDPYAINAVIASSLPAPLPSSAIPGAINPNIINGITKDKKLEKIPVMVTNIFVAHNGKNREATIPATIAMITFGSNPILNLNFIFAQLNGSTLL